MKRYLTNFHLQFQVLVFHYRTPQPLSITLTNSTFAPLSLLHPLFLCFLLIMLSISPVALILLYLFLPFRSPAPCPYMNYRNPADPNNRVKSSLNNQNPWVVTGNPGIMILSDNLFCLVENGPLHYLSAV